MGRIFALILIFTGCFFISEAKFDLYTRGLKCTNIDSDYYLKVNCNLKAIRGRKGIISAIAALKKPIEHPWMHVQLFWKSSSQRFQPYILDLDLDLCDTHNFLNTTNQIIKRLLAMADHVVNREGMEMIKGDCPMLGNIIIEELDCDRDFKQYIPPIAPKGTYKVVLHFHNNNKTLVDVEVIAEVHHIGLSDFIALG